MGDLRVENLRKEFRFKLGQRIKNHFTKSSLVAVDGLSFALHPGEIYGLLGPNGAGKTTTLRMIASLIKPSEGKIYFEGKDINDDVREYRKRIGFLTSELKLDGYFSPFDTFSYMGKLYGMQEGEIATKREGLFASFGIAEFQDKPIKDLSTGMKQKVSLAISLCHDPDVIIFDEPTNGLDIIAAKDVEDYLFKMREEGKTILISTHIFSLVEKLCDRVGIIIGGRLVLDSSMEEIHKKGNLEDVFFALYQEGNK